LYDFYLLVVKNIIEEVLYCGIDIIAERLIVNFYPEFQQSIFWQYWETIDRIVVAEKDKTVRPDCYVVFQADLQ